MHTTTLNEIRKYNPCIKGYTTLRESLPPDATMNTPITFEHILNSNGISDALWVLRVFGPINKQAEAFVLECLDEIEKEKVPLDKVEGLRDYVKRNRARVLAEDCYRMLVADYINIACELESEDQATTLFRKHFCTPGVTYGPTYPTE